MADTPSMLSICDQIHIVLIRTTAMGEMTLVSSNFFEWRPLLASKTGHLNVSIELKGIGEFRFILKCRQTFLFISVKFKQVCVCWRRDYMVERDTVFFFHRHRLRIVR